MTSFPCKDVSQLYNRPIARLQLHLPLRLNAWPTEFTETILRSLAGLFTDMELVIFACFVKYIKKGTGDCCYQPSQSPSCRH